MCQWPSLLSVRGKRRKETDLVVTSTEDEVGVGVLVQELLDNLALVDRERADLEILLSDEHCKRDEPSVSGGRTVLRLRRGAGSPSIGRRGASVLSSKSWHCLHWNDLRRGKAQEGVSARSSKILLEDWLSAHPKSGSDAR